MAYITATFARLDRNADGRATIVLVYTGNAGEAPVEYNYPIDATVMPTADHMRGLAMARLAVLNNNLSFVTGALPFIGTVLDTTTPIPPPSNGIVPGTFMAASAPFTPGATPQDVFAITGSATKTITVLRMAITTVQTTAAMNAWALVKRSTANTGGTSALVTAVQVNDIDPAATASVRQYTANPTAGTLIGSVWTGRVPAPAPATAFAGASECVVWGQNFGPAVVLTGTTDVLAWNLGGVALPAGLSVQASVWWRES